MDNSFGIQTPIDNKSNIPPLAFNCSYASSVINKNAEFTDNLRNILKICGIRLHLRISITNFADSTYICRFNLHFAESTYSCGIQNNLLYLLVAESATEQMCRQSLSYSYMYAVSCILWIFCSKSKPHRIIPWSFLIIIISASWTITVYSFVIFLYDLLLEHFSDLLFYCI